MTSLRLYTVGVARVVYHPADDRQLVTADAALRRLIEFHEQDPERVATLIQRVPVTGRVRLYRPDGLVVSRDAEGNRLRLRLIRLMRDVESSGLVLGVPSWIARVDRTALAQLNLRSADRSGKRRK